MRKVSKRLNNVTKNFYSDEWYTDIKTVNKMIELLNPLPKSKILCPFDTENSNFVKQLKEQGHEVIYGINDFLKSNKYNFDYIITNPPFSIKDAVIEKCLESGKRTCLVLPIEALGGVKRHEIFEKYNTKLERYIPTRRVNYYDKNWKKRDGSNFHSIFIIFDKENVETKITFEFEEEKIKQMKLF